MIVGNKNPACSIWGVQGGVREPRRSFKTPTIQPTMITHNNVTNPTNLIHTYRRSIYHLQRTHRSEGGMTSYRWLRAPPLGPPIYNRNIRGVEQ